jgi:hypothetical protein
MSVVSLSPLALAALNVLIRAERNHESSIYISQIARRLKRGSDKATWAALEELCDAGLAKDYIWHDHDRPAECDHTWYVKDVEEATRVYADLTAVAQSCAVEVVVGPRSRPSALACRS